MRNFLIRYITFIFPVILFQKIAFYVYQDEVKDGELNLSVNDIFKNNICFMYSLYQNYNRKCVNGLSMNIKKIIITY